METLHIKKRNLKFVHFILLSISLYNLFLVFAGYFKIGLLSEDYLNFISSQGSSIKQKLTSSVANYSNLYFRPLWFFSVDFSIRINNLLIGAKDNFILFRIENLLYFLLLASLASYLLYSISRNYMLSAVFCIMILIYPNNINDICQTVGKADLLCAVFLLLALIFTFEYLKSKSTMYMVLTLVFFSLSLLTKETSIILPFITVFIIYLIFDKEKVYEIKNLAGLEFLLLGIYASYRIFILGLQPPDVVSKYPGPSLLNSLGVSFKAFISLIIPYDYLSIQNFIAIRDPFFLLYFFLTIVFLVGIIFFFTRPPGTKYIFYMLLIFLISISPNLIGGYFGPQLTLIPFLLFYFSLFVILNKIKARIMFLKIIFPLLLIFWGVLSFNLIKDWSFAYQYSGTVVKKLIDMNLDFNKRNIILGLPSRLRQSSVLSGAIGPYNYWKYLDFRLRDKFSDLIYTGSLDTNSLNAELTIKPMGEGEYEIETTGETQYFLRPDNNSSRYKDGDIIMKLSDNNLFHKPTQIDLKILSKNVAVYVFNKDSFLQ